MYELDKKTNMWLKSTSMPPKYSDFAPKGSIKSSVEINGQFKDVPNYRLAGKSFDVQHLDKFLMRFNEARTEQTVSDEGETLSNE